MTLVFGSKLELHMEVGLLNIVSFGSFEKKTSHFPQPIQRVTVGRLVATTLETREVIWAATDLTSLYIYICTTYNIT